MGRPRTVRPQLRRDSLECTRPSLESRMDECCAGPAGEETLASDDPADGRHATA